MPTTSVNTQIVERGCGYLESNVKSEVEKQLNHFHSPVREGVGWNQRGVGGILNSTYMFWHCTYCSLIAKMARFCSVS